MTDIFLRVIYAGVSFTIPILTSAFVHRRYQIPYTLIAVGILTFTIAFFVQTVILTILDHPFVHHPLIGSVFLGMVIGFTDIGARFWGYWSVAKSTVYRPQAVMIGVGHGMARLVYDGAVVALFARAIPSFGEIFAAIAQWGLHITVSWVVLQTFLRNELAWTFQAIFWIGAVLGTEAFILEGAEEPIPLLIIFWIVISILNGRIFWDIKPPFIRQ